MSTLKKKKNQMINFIHYGVMLSFSLESDGRMYLLYCGKETSKVPQYSKNNHNFRTFVEAEILEDDRNKAHGLKNIETSYALTYKYVSHKEVKNDKGYELIIVTTNDKLEVETHFQFYIDVCGLSSYNIVRNISSSNVTLLSLSSFVYIGFSKANVMSNYLYSCDNSWHCEAQWKKDSFYHLGIYNGNDYFVHKRFIISNCGGWSTKNNLPMMVIENKSKHECQLVQIENNGSWHLEVADVRNHLYYLASGPEFKDHQFKKILKSNETFTSCQASLTFASDFEKAIKEITKIRRIYRKPNLDDEKLPVIFNDYMHALWDTQTTELITPLVDIASEVGCEIFCMDAGWFEKGSKWWDIIGEWTEYKDNFPSGGLKAVCDYIRSKNMTPGLWLEPEAVGINSKIAKKMDDDFFFCHDGKRVVVSERYMLNFDNHKVYQYMLDTVCRLIEEYDLKYLKFDYNFDIGVGNNLNHDSLGEGLLAHNRAFIKWLNEITNKYPDVAIENCASGGCRMDNEILKYCSIQSTSDQTSYKKYPYLSGNVLTATTPEQAAVWSYPVNAYIKGYMPSDEAVAANMCNAMLGRIHLASYINKLPSHQIELIKEGIRFFKSISDMKKHSYPIYPLGTAHFFDKRVVAGIEDDASIILGVWNTSSKPQKIKVDLSKYQVRDVKVGYPTTLNTSYLFDKDTKILEVNFDSPNSGRIFVINK